MPGATHFHKALLPGVLILVFSAFLFILSELKTHYYFRDYAIIFEGAYRLYCGQIPFRDFSAPVGPGSFVLPAIFFMVLGPTWSSLLYSQFAVSVLMLVTLYLILRQIRANVPAIVFSLALFTGLYLSTLSHPWYNTTALLLLMLTTLFALGNSLSSVAAAGACAAAGILTKQDFGGISVVMALCFIGLIAMGSDRETLLPSPLPKPKRVYLQTWILRTAVFSGVLLASLTLFIWGTDPLSFSQSFNYGQPPHGRHGPPLLELMQLISGSLGGLLLVLALQRDSFRLLVAALFVGASAVTKMTSGLLFTHFYFVAFMPLALIEIVSKKYRYHWPLVGVMGIILILACREPAKLARVELQNAWGPTNPIRPGLSAPVPFGANLPAFEGRLVAPQQTVFTLEKLVEKLKARSSVAGKAHPQARILNISELTPLYAVLQQDPPLHLPVWFHTGVTMFDTEMRALKSTLAGDTYDAVLIQGTHEGLTENYKSLLTVMNQNPAYALAVTISDAPAEFAPIYVYLRR